MAIISSRRNEIKVRMKVFHDLSAPRIYVSLVLVKITGNVVTARWKEKLGLFLKSFISRQSGTA